jgi:hypothetical protein
MDFELDGVNRAWYITSTRVDAGLSHRLMLKKRFPDEWSENAEYALSEQLLKDGVLKIGIYSDGFDVHAYEYDDERKRLLQEFCAELLKTQSDMSDVKFTMFQVVGNVKQHTVKEIVDGVLFVGVS